VGATELVDIGGRRLNVWRAGAAGPVVLLVHGIPTNHLLWYDVVPALQDRAQVLAVDMLGYGWSDAPDGDPVDIASQAGYLLSLLDALRFERCVVVGHDLGGGVAQILATTSPDRIAGMCVANGVCFDSWPVPGVRAVKASWPALALTPPALLAAALQPVLRTLFVHQDRARVFAPRFADPWRAPDGPKRLSRHVRATDSVYTQAVAPFLRRLAMPVEIVWGRQDSQLEPRYGRQLAEAIPGARLTEVPDASHFVPADVPEAVVAAVGRVLDRL
jgi:2-hydroxymuconate-semialdehyde hydrolase